MDNENGTQVTKQVPITFEVPLDLKERFRASLPGGVAASKVLRDLMEQYIRQRSYRTEPITKAVGNG